MSETLHATAVAIDDHAVLIEGPSGAGKSDLALRLIDRGAVLVSDDRTIVTLAGGRLLASAPATIAGRFEIRGTGIVTLPHAADVPVALLVRLATPERMPEPNRREVAGVAVPLMLVDGFEGSAPIKVEMVLRAIVRDGMDK